MVDLLLKQGETTRALTYAERAEGRVLLDVLSNGRADINKAMTKDELDRDRALTMEINGLNTQISRLKATGQKAELPALAARLEKARLEYEVFQTGLYAAHPELRRGAARHTRSRWARRTGSWRAGTRRCSNTSSGRTTATSSC